MSIAIGLVMIFSVAVAVALPLLRAETAYAPERADDRRELLEREKTVALLAIREADFDRATGKLTDDDYAVLRRTYEQRALGAMSALEGDERTGSSPGGAGEAGGGAPAVFCPACGLRFAAGDRFCARCGRPRPALA